MEYSYVELVALHNVGGDVAAAEESSDPLDKLSADSCTTDIVYACL